MGSSAVNQAPGGCNCEGDDCYAYNFTLVISLPGNGCDITVFIGEPWEPGDTITGCFPFLSTCTVSHAGMVGEVCYTAGVWDEWVVTGYLESLDDVTYPPGQVCFPPDLLSGTTSVCVLGCDGEPIPGATVTISSDDPSGPFSAPPPSEGDVDVPPFTTGDDGCLSFDVPAGLDPDAPITVVVNAPSEYKPTTITTSLNELAANDYEVTPDVADGYTCCDMDFRKEGDPPYPPRPKTLSFVTSGAAGPDEIWDIEVGCDGTACTLSDELSIIGSAPIVGLCPGGPGTGSDGPWDYWDHPTLTSGRVPMMVRVWYDGTDWHCSATVYHTVARPPNPAFGGCSADPSLGIGETYGWLRSDASCVDTDDPKLSIAPDPELAYPLGSDPDGGTYYSGSTTPITVTNSSYTVNSHNPVDITFHFPTTTLAFHGGLVAVQLVDSITVWQP